jgi:hypothetical protein
MQFAIPSINVERIPGSLQPDNHEAVMRQFIEVVINNSDMRLSCLPLQVMTGNRVENQSRHARV